MRMPKPNKRVIVDIYDAVGGPEVSSPGDDGHEKGPTDSGKFVMAYCGKHSSTRYPDWSKIRWGTPLKEDSGQLFVFHNGKWRPLSDFTPVTRDDILDYHESLYKTRVIPNEWLFNDFGHQTCYYFNDVNRDFKLTKSKGEKIHGEFIHTTPENEAHSAHGTTAILIESHGCIHAKPKDIDDMITKKYLRKGNMIVIHKYNEIAPTQPHGRGSLPYEVHFYPNSKKIVIIGIRK